MSAGVISASSPEVFTLLVLTAAILSIFDAYQRGRGGRTAQKRDTDGPETGGIQKDVNLDTGTGMALSA